MIEERESRAARYREQRAREEIEQQRANMIREMNQMKRDIKKKEDAILLEMQNKSVQTPPPSRGRNDPSTVATVSDSKTGDDEETVDEFNGDVKDAMTQTIVDEECLWESEDTYVVAISGPVLEKVWRERNEAVEKFYGEFVAKRKQDPLAGPDEDPAAAKPQTNIDLPKSLTKVHKKKKLNGKGQWLITPIIRDFMANIPKTVQAQAIKPLSWLSKTIDLLYQSKLAADYLDLRDGDPLQTLNDFLTEFLLMKYKLRRVAEMHMYEIIMCVKKYYKKNSKVRMFAKFLGCVKDKSSAEETEEQQNKPELDIGVLQVFLYIRNRLLTPPKQLELAVPQTPAIGDNASKYDEDHVAFTNDCKTFVPLGHAIKEMRRVSSFMARRKLEKFLRTVERAVAIRHPSGKVKPVDGERMQVRFTMRAAMLDNVKSQEEIMEESQNNDGDSKGPEDDSANIQVVADVDVCLEILIEILEIREKQIYNNLIRAFVDGDDNGDGILDIDEFTEIIKVLKPTYSSRRALRMFKRALEQGEENSSSLERHAFVQTCKEYGLALLVDTRALDLADAEKALAANMEAPRTAASTGSRNASSRK